MHHAIPQAPESAGADPVSADAWTVRFFLCFSALLDLSRTGPEFFFFGNAERCCETAVYYRWVRCVRVAHSLGNYVHGSVDSAAGRQTLAGAPSSGVRKRGAGRDSLL